MQRYSDSGQLSISRTPSGGLRVDAHVTAARVFVYKFSDGTERRELRHPREVFAEDSIASLRGAVVTDGHPPEMVTAANWATYARGHVGDDVRPDGDKLRAPVNVEHADLLAKIDSNGDDAIRECSCGYTADYVPGPGTFNGEAYDGEQRNIRYNHVALGPVAWGRAGSDVRLLLDSNTAICVGDSTTTPATGATEKGDDMKIIFQGREYDLATPAGASAYHDAREAEHAAAVARATDAETRAAAAVARADAAEARATPEAIASAAAERARLIAFGRAKDRRFCADKKDAAMPLDALIARLLKMYAPGYDPAGKTPEVLAEVLAAVLPSEPASEATEPAADAAQEGAMGGAEETAKPGLPPEKPAALDSIHEARGIGNAGPKPANGAGTREAIFDEVRARRLRAAELPKP